MFKEQLAEQEEFDLKVAVDAGLGEKLDLLLPIFKDYMLRRVDDTIKPEMKVKDFMGAMELGEDTLDELEWFERFFPANLEHKNIVGAYNALATTFGEAAAASAEGANNNKSDGLLNELGQEVRERDASNLSDGAGDALMTDA